MEEFVGFFVKLATVYFDYSTFNRTSLHRC